MLSSQHDLSFPLPGQTHLLSFLSNQPTTWKGAHVFSSDAPLPLSPPTSLIPHFLSFHLPSIPLFLSSNHLWSLSSSSPSTSDPPFPHHPMLRSQCSPSCDVPVWGLPVQEPACVVALGQRWHRPAGMRGNRVWAFLYKRTIKPTAVHNELILIQVRCTSCILACRSLSFLLIIDYTVYLCFWATLFICSPRCSTCCGLMRISLADCMQYEKAYLLLDCAFVMSEHEGTSGAPALTLQTPYHQTLYTIKQIPHKIRMRWNCEASEVIVCLRRWARSPCSGIDRFNAARLFHHLHGLMRSAWKMKHAKHSGFRTSALKGRQYWSAIAHVNETWWMSHYDRN